MYSSETNISGIIVKAISGFYYVASGNSVIECKARGNFRHTKISPIVGDRVEISLTSENAGLVQKVLPRKNCLTRPIIANIDKLIIVSSFVNPAPDTYLIDRMTAISEFNGIKPIVVFNKSEIGDLSEYVRIYKKAGFNTYTVCASDPKTLKALKEEFKDCVCAMAGNSGVGKSSLLNSLFEELNLQTGEVSVALGRGKHTTRHTELFVNSLGGFVADTPGFSSVIQLDNRLDFKNNLARCFSDFVPYIDNCRFSSCTHICEKGCGVLAAVSSGDIEKTRHDRYVTLYTDLKDVPDWYANKIKG